MLRFKHYSPILKNKKENEKMLKHMVRFAKQDEGATAPEYGLMVALIAVVIIGAVTTLGLNLNGVFGQIAGSIGAAS
jgi:pilus assembly protein Flp/PilA